MPGILQFLFHSLVVSTSTTAALHRLIPPLDFSAAFTSSAVTTSCLSLTQLFLCVPSYQQSCYCRCPYQPVALRNHIALVWHRFSPLLLWDLATEAHCDNIQRYPIGCKLLTGYSCLTLCSHSSMIEGTAKLFWVQFWKCVHNTRLHACTLLLL